MEILKASRSGTVCRFFELNQLDPSLVNPQFSRRPLVTVRDMFDLLKAWFVGQGSAFGALFVMDGARVCKIYAGVHFAPEQMYFDFEDASLKDLTGQHLLYVHSRQEDQIASLSFVLGNVRRSLFPSEVDIDFLQEFESVVSPGGLKAYTISVDGCLQYYSAPVELEAPHLSMAGRVIFCLEVESYLKTLGVE